ncbi:nicotinamide riboside transporter PnuC [Legionella beliardensis]|uniref:nicotinamide riboside transporter PnuC n=1 Tax=Legionella beliardensis TaxID=91822 RepID=UPI000E1B5E3E|nr:nicotinamide riboside transporter PnuC [Legionella beliardensis]
MFLDIVGALTSFLATYYFIRLNSRGWLISLVATSLNGWLYWQKGIYSDMLLESFYFITTCYGWLQWQRPITSTNKPILVLKEKQWFTLGIAILALFMIIFFILTAFTNSNVAALDALTTALSLAGQWLMCHKIITTWLIWFITDALYAYLYLQKHIPFHVLLMLIYTIMASYGYFSWLKALRNHRRDRIQLIPN